MSEKGTTAARPLTLACVPEAEGRAKAALAALVSAAVDAAGEAFAGAALGGPPAFGEGLAVRGEGGDVFLADPLELLVVLEGSVRGAAALGKKVRRGVGEAARTRRTAFTLAAMARAELALLPPTLANLELLAARRIVAGEATLLSAAPDPAGMVPAPMEGLRLLVRTGASLLAAERAVDRVPAGAPTSAALRSVAATDLALGAAVLLCAGRWTPGIRARNDALRALARRGAEGEKPAGFHGRMAWTRFRDLVDRHKAALEARESVTARDRPTDAMRQVARAIDRWLEVLRLFEEERLGTSLPDWTEYACRLEARRKRLADGSLFPAEDEAGLRAALALPARRAARTWERAERVAPALAALLDWDPGDLPVAPVLLDLPDGTPRDALRQRAIALGREA
ncbi:MAG TPA: hypothetical protein VLH41_09465 [Thermoanaerobaculia bacterium]|nr:hypothetical protein [Thermoanaerobaculia bacterium]